MKLTVLSSEGPGLAAEVLYNGTILGVMDNFSPYDGVIDYKKKNLILEEPEFSAVFDDDIEWDVIFSENKERKKALIRIADTWQYQAYGQITSINPIVVDFGVIEIEVDLSGSDPRLVGEYVYFRIDRLSLDAFGK